MPLFNYSSLAKINRKNVNKVIDYCYDNGIVKEGYCVATRKQLKKVPVSCWKALAKHNNQMKFSKNYDLIPVCDDLYTAYSEHIIPYDSGVSDKSIIKDLKKSYRIQTQLVKKND